jgi:hypothetical protein
MWSLWWMACSPQGAVAVCDHAGLFEKSEGESLQGAGWHRLYLDGGSGVLGADGRYRMTEHRNLAALGDHFLLSAGALVEWGHPLDDPLSGLMKLHVARVNDPGVVARYALFLERPGAAPAELFSVDVDQDGHNGTVPYEHCFSADVPRMKGGASLLLRMTNLSGGDLGIVVAAPDYYSWVDIELR